MLSVANSWIESEFLIRVLDLLLLIRLRVLYGAVLSQDLEDGDRLTYSTISLIPVSVVVKSK